MKLSMIQPRRRRKSPKMSMPIGVMKVVTLKPKPRNAWCLNSSWREVWLWSVRNLSSRQSWLALTTTKIVQLTIMKTYLRSALQKTKTSFTHLKKRNNCNTTCNSSYLAIICLNWKNLRAYNPHSNALIVIVKVRKAKSRSQTRKIRFDKRLSSTWKKTSCTIMLSKYSISVVQIYKLARTSSPCMISSNKAKKMIKSTLAKAKQEIILKW